MSRTLSRFVVNALRSRYLLPSLLLALVAVALVVTLPSEAQRSRIVREPATAQPMLPLGSFSEESVKEGLERRLGMPQFGVDEMDGRDSPPDLTPYARPLIAADHIRRPAAPAGVTATVVDAVMSNTDPNLKTTEFFGDSETNIAVDPANTNSIVITAFSSNTWTSANAAIWVSSDGGTTWTKRTTVPAPPGAGGVSGTGCPCDQSVEFGRAGLLSGTFLTFSPTDVYSGVTTNPSSAASWQWANTAGVATKTNTVAPGNVDQPWLNVNLDPLNPAQDNTYVAYDDFSISPRGMRVAVSRGQNPPLYTSDVLVGLGPTGFINPGLRLAKDSVSGTMYALWQQLAAVGDTTSRSINYMLNRSTDGGLTWTLNGSATGVLVANANSTQPTNKFGTVNALLGGVDAAAVDPTNGDVYYVYGNRDGATGNNRLSIKRLVSDGAGGLTIGTSTFVTGQVQAALPSIAITTGGTIGIFYYTSDGIVSGFPQFTAHFATSTDHGQTFPADTVLETFLSSATDNANSSQRVLGDYHQVRAIQNTFYGSFTGNGAPFGRPSSNHDPIFYKVSVLAPTAAGTVLAGRVMSPDGTALRGAVIRITDQRGGVLTAFSNAFGYFHFEAVSAGQTYVLKAHAKGYVFDSRLITMSDSITGLDLVAR